MVKIKHHFDPSFFDEEERYGFHIEKWRKEVWAVELDLLYELDRVCKELNLQYFLSFGCLIGAARDGHFIPWDDDIDLVMMRHDYDILVQKGPAHFKSPYFLQTGYNEIGYFKGHSQLRNSDTCGALPNEIDRVPYNQGIFIDIFVLDYFHDDLIKKQTRKKVGIGKKYGILEYKDKKSNLKTFIKKYYRKFLKGKYHTLSDLYAKYDDVFRTNKTEFVENLLFRTGRTKELHKFPAEWFEKPKYLRFEDGVFPVPDQYDKFLAMRYGKDYLTPKQIPNTHSKHGSVIFDTDKSYLEIIKMRKDTQNNK